MGLQLLLRESIMKTLGWGVSLGLLLCGARVSHAEAPIHKLVTVQAANDEWADTRVKVSAGDIILVVARGEVGLGGFGGKHTNGGRAGHDGVLQIKLGTTTVFDYRPSVFLVAQTDGQLKLRVRDTRYDDNSGSYSTNVIVIPGSSIPSPDTVQ